MPGRKRPSRKRLTLVNTVRLEETLVLCSVTYKNLIKVVNCGQLVNNVPSVLSCEDTVKKIDIY